MKYRILAAFLSVVLMAGCVGEVSYAAPTSVNAQAEQENWGDGTVSDGDREEIVLTESGLAENEQEPVAVDISANTLQDGGLLAEAAKEGDAWKEEDIVPIYQAVDADTYSAVEEALKSAYDSFAAECDLTEFQILTSDIGSVIAEVLNTNPGYFYVDSGFSYYYSGSYVTKVVIKYEYAEADAAPMVEAFDEAVAVAVEGADESWTEMEKALYINEYLARNCEYDTTYAREFRHSAYGALVNKVAVCQGYALAYVVLAEELGLNCEVVTSYSMNHAWNMIEVNDKYYQVDTTWNDPINDKTGRAGHQYFMKSTAYYQTSDANHYEEDDWEITGGWDDTYSNDTTYDTYFWNSIDLGFDYVGGDWYGFNGSAIARYSCDGTDFAQQEELVQITDVWYVWGGTSSYWPKKYVGVSAFDKRYYYSTKTAIYQLNLSDNTSKLIYELTDTEKTEGYIYAMHISPTGEVYYVLSTSPNEDGTKYHTITLEKVVSKYTVSFDGNGATSGEMSSMPECKYGTSYSLNANAYVRAGYTFVGWNTEADGSGTNYTDEAAFRNLSEEDGSTITLYAQWAREKFAITYILDGGENSSENPEEYTADSEAIILQDAEKEGYIFEGWYTDEEYTKQITEITKGSTGSLILHAKWRAVKYHVAFEGNGADEGSMAALMDKEYRDSYQLPANTYKRAGYEFVGWNTDPDGNGTSYVDEAAVLNLTDVDGSTVVLFAQWRKLTYTITYQLNGGENSAANPTTYDITTQALPLQNPVRTGYTFEGWYTDEAFSGQITEISQGNVGNITLYAKWNANKYNIIFNKNKATGGTMAAMTISYGDSVKLTANKYKRNGYMFTGWNTKANGKGTSYADKTRVQNLTAENGGTITLYAQWKKNYINKKKTTIYVGSSETLKLTGTKIKSVKTSNKKVATVTSKGKVTAKKAGKATITLKGKDGKSYKCTVTVKNPTINAKKKTLKVGKSFTLKLTGTTIKSASSSDRKVATVTSKGKVTAKGKGTATITLKGKDKKSYKCTITVK